MPRIETALSGPTRRDLTTREHEVMKLAQQGFTTNEIADQLGIRPNTVSTYRRKAVFKTGVHSRYDRD